MYIVEFYKTAVLLFKEVIPDIFHMLRHSRWMYKDPNKHWHCTLCNVDLSDFRSLPRKD